MPFVFYEAPNLIDGGQGGYDSVDGDDEYIDDPFRQILNQISHSNNDAPTTPKRAGKYGYES